MRRRLSFDSFDDLLNEVDRLARADYCRAGNWDLAQVCNHLADSFAWTRTGFAFRAPWLVRRALGPLAIRYIFWLGRIPIRASMPKRFDPQPATDPAAAMARLREELRLFQSWGPPYVEHPFFGPITREQWRRIHLLHAAHHVGFLVPIEAGQGGERVTGGVADARGASRGSSAPAH